MPTAVLIDGGYFIKRFRRIEPENAYNASRAADQVHRWALAHLRSPTGEARDLYRIFFYDCPPLLKRMHNPISGECVDYSRSPEALFRRELHEKLRQMRKVALRLGHLTDFNTWSANPGVLDDLLSSLALKRQVRQIVLMAGDADFVPAAKLARREGVDFVLDPMWSAIPQGLVEHIDGMRSVCPRPQKKDRTLANAAFGIAGG